VFWADGAGGFVANSYGFGSIFNDGWRHRRAWRPHFDAHLGQHGALAFVQHERHGMAFRGGVARVAATRAITGAPAASS
jgi:hypothetical protein